MIQFMLILYSNYIQNIGLWEIEFDGTHLEFETIYEGVFKIKHSGYGYMKPKITIYE